MIAKSSGMHLNNLVQDILDMSRIENGQFEIHNENFDLKDTL